MIFKNDKVYHEIWAIKYQFYSNLGHQTPFIYYVIKMGGSQLLMVDDMGGGGVQKPPKIDYVIYKCSIKKISIKSFVFPIN